MVSKRVVLAYCPGPQKLERGYKNRKEAKFAKTALLENNGPVFPLDKCLQHGTSVPKRGTKNPNEGTFSKTALLRNRPFTNLE